jgi:hypothetical protein
VFKKIWHDPVWSKVISAAIIAAVAAAYAYYKGWLPAVLHRIVSGWIYVISPIAIPRWLLVALVLLGLYAVLITVKALLPQKPAGPNWTSYTTDSFDGLRWRWRYYGHEIHNLYSFCPHCDFQVYPDDTSSYAARIGFRCESCGRNLGTVRGPYGAFQDKITRLIQQKLRTGSFLSPQQ